MKIDAVVALGNMADNDIPGVQKVLEYVVALEERTLVAENQLRDIKDILYKKRKRA